MARFIHALDLYEKHQRNKTQRQVTNRKEIEFGLKTYEEMQPVWEPYRKGDELMYKFEKLELQWADLEWETWLANQNA